MGTTNTNKGLATIAEKLATAKWLIKPIVHSKLCKQVEGYMRHPVTVADDNVQTDLVPSKADVSGETDLHAIVNITGILSKGVSELEEQLLGLTDVDWITTMLDMVAEDATVKDIILNISSPGGETTGIEELGRKIVDIDTNVKPVYCWTENQADSAAYWLASQGRQVGMTPSAQIGGVGVYVLVLDETRKMKEEGISIEAIHAGKYKMMGHEFRELTKEERAILQDDVNKQHEKFKNVITARRPQIDEDDLEGLSFNGEDGFEKGFCDVLTDNLEEFISSIEDNSINIYNNMKTTVVTKVKAKAASTEVKKEETKVEATSVAVASPKLSTEVDVKPAKLSFMDRLKQLMGDYDGNYQKAEEEDMEEKVPGVPGTAEEKAEEKDDNCDEGMEECQHCKGKGKMKKAKAEEAEEEEAEEEELPKKAEGKYDGGYEEQRVALAAPKAEAATKLEFKLPTQEEFLAACGVHTAPEPKALNDWQKICHEAFSGNQFKKS